MRQVHHHRQTCDVQIFFFEQNDSCEIRSYFFAAFMALDTLSTPTSYILVLWWPTM